MVAVNYLTQQKDTRTYAAGDVLFSAGEAGELAYGVLEGRVQIIHNDYVIDTLETGDIFGEDVMIGHHHYHATAIAITDVTVVAMKRHQFLWLVQQTPTFATQMMGAMSERVEKVLQLLD